MRLRNVLQVGVVFAAVVALSGNRVLSQQDEQEEKKDQKGGPNDAKMEAWMKAAQPGEHHAHLDVLIGQWNLHTKWRFGPEAPWEESTGTAEFKWVMGKRFIVQQTGSPMGDQKYEGMGILGYDNTTKKHFSTWIDNMSTMLMTSEGACDESGKVVTLYGTLTDPMTGLEKTQKSISRIINKDKHVFEMYERAPDGKEYQSLVVTYTRS